ncbi:heme-binding protein [Alphaproteobacteria bacterium KMM 3653]|uniref:Heme-binding protein n=1 Tax=Harenicola maris TaxID=2841044 RepID=A0AAP2G388_9RHOB|nr:heme-binding protein [Harenicola maris]
MQTIKRLDLADAQVMLDAAVAKAQEIGVAMSIAVMDEGANLLAFARMDNSKITGISIAMDKCYTAAAARKATHELGEVSQPGGLVYGLNTCIGGRMVIVGGGLPVFVDGQPVGGIGVSSGTPTQDQEVAQAGIDALLDYLRNSD